MRAAAEILLDLQRERVDALSHVGDPNNIFHLRAKRDEAGHYDDFEVDRVVEVELDPQAKESDLVTPCRRCGADIRLRSGAVLPA